MRYSSVAFFLSPSPQLLPHGLEDTSTIEVSVVYLPPIFLGLSNFLLYHYEGALLLHHLLVIEIICILYNMVVCTAYYTSPS